jgi:hypothetical protein
LPGSGDVKKGKMHKLTEAEFRDRVQAVARARGIFIKSGLTDHIGHAFELYQLVLAETERPLTLDTSGAGNRPRSYFDKYERLKCPDCGHDLYIRPVRQNSEGIQFQLICSNPEHDMVLSPDMTLAEFEKELVLKDAD